MQVHKIILVDDHELVRDGVRLLLMDESSIEIVGEASNADQMFSLIDSVIPHVIFLDITMPGISGIEATKTLTQKHPDIGIVMLTTHDDEEYIFGALDAGARGYLSKDSRKEELLNAVESVANGGGYYSKKISKIIITKHLKARRKESFQQEIRLTEREVEILTAICNGKNNREMADQFFLSIRTVEGHKTKLLNKLGLKTVAQLVVFAIKNDYFSID